MDEPTERTVEQCYAELAEFCFRRMTSLEARFIILCTRAQAAGIECSDLHGATASEEVRREGVTALN